MKCNCDSIKTNCACKKACCGVNTRRCCPSCSKTFAPKAAPAKKCCPRCAVKPEEAHRPDIATFDPHPQEAPESVPTKILEVAEQPEFGGDLFVPREPEGFTVHPIDDDDEYPLNDSEWLPEELPYDPH